jgi:hypothetical protein
MEFRRLAFRPDLNFANLPQDPTAREGAMRFRRCVFVAILIAITGLPAARGSDYSKVTCREFLASGQANMAALFMFLRGYHAGMSGIVSFDQQGPYAARLGYYCKNHPNANLIESSERILSEVDRGI